MDSGQRCCHEALPRPGGLWQLSLWLVALAAVWGIALPWLASRPAIDAHIQWLDERGIDPSAMYYTELEAMKPILQKVNDRLRRQTAQQPTNQTRSERIR